ncbi:hypothetical protein AYI70_g281 [Smittium culicis]|uniref:CCHC-type domain-containing protein n=1 Tax=Smittium culicis TaxID=133412 RepID=A0A1R1YHW1_9FUNG|nr:hypothetical protein AYI70_g281 [Smittium culicis]
MTTSFEVFPTKFDIKDVKKDNVDVWISSFRDAISFNEVLEEDAKKLLRLWLVGDAAQWRLDIQSIADSKSWDLSKWLDELKLKFGVKPSDKIGDIWKLAELRKGSESSWSDFNKEFKKYLNTIPVNLYTMDWVKQTYLKAVACADRDIWWAVYRDNKGKTLEYLIKDIEEISKEKEEGLRGVDVVDLKTKEIARKYGNSVIAEVKETISDSKHREKSEISELTDAFKSWMLLNQRRATPQNASSYLCYVCGKRGHYSKECPKSPLNESKNLSKQEPFGPPNKSLLAINSEELGRPTDALISIPNPSKRMRVDEIINRPLKAVEHRESRLGKPKKSVKKKTKPKARISEWSTRILNSSAQISVRELLSIKPSLLSELLSCLRKSNSAESRHIFYAENGKTEISNDKTFTPSYIMMSYKNRDLPILIDTGASYSLMNKEIVTKLGIPLKKMRKPIFIQSVSGKTIKLEEKCRITVVLENEEQVEVDFVIMENCAVPVLLGMDGCKSLKVRLYYDKNLLSYKFNDNRESVQLHSRENIYEELMDWESEESDLMTSAYESDESPDEIVPLFYASLESEISDQGCPEASALSETDKEGNIVPKEAKQLVEKYNQIFEISEFERPEIKNSIYEISIPEDTK